MSKNRTLPDTVIINSKALQYLITFLLTISLIAIPTSGHVAQAAVLLLFLLAPILLWNKHIWLKTKEPIFQIFLFFFFAALPLAIKSDEGEPLDVPSRYLVVSVIFLALYRIKLPYHLVTKAVLISIPIAFIASLFEEGYRLSLGIGIIESGTVFSICFFFLIAYIFYSTKLKIQLTSVVLCFICIYLLILTGARGSWLALLGTALICGYIFYGKNNKLPYFGAICCSLLVMTTLYFNSSMVEKRTNSIMSDIQKLTSQSFKSSTGQRIAVWELSIHGFLKSPLHGLSYNEIAQLRDSYQQESGIRLSGSDDGRASSHNELLNIMLKQGSIGLIALLSLYVVPLLHFYKKYKAAVSMTIKMHSFMGISLITSISISGLTEAVLMHGAIATWYAIILTILFHTIRQEEASVDTDKIKCSPSS